MAVNKVEFGGETLVDLTNDTVTPNSLLSGYSAHNKAGEQIVGTADVAIRWENVSNGSYKFAQSGDRWIANNRGVNLSAATSTWKVTVQSAQTAYIAYRTATESVDKLSIVLNGTTVLSATGGLKSSETVLTLNLVSGENTIVATYTKDGSVHSYGDMAYVVLPPIGEQPGQYKYQSKSVTPGTSLQTVYPDTGYDGLYSVSVAATSGSNGNFKSGSGTFPTANSTNISLNIGFVPKILVIYGIKSDKSFGYVTTYNANFNSANEYGAQLPVVANGTAYAMSKKAIGSTNATIKSIGSTTIISCGNVTGWRGHPMTWYAWG